MAIVRPNIVDWFNVHDRKHVEAWAVLRATGMWPKGFIPEGMEFPDQWQQRIEDAMAREYCRAMLGYVPHQYDAKNQENPRLEDTADNAETERVFHGDVFYVPGEGIAVGGAYATSERQRQYEIARRKQIGRESSQEGYWITEDEVCSWADEIRKRGRMVKLSGRARRKHAGTDAERGADSLPGHGDDHYEVDRSQSSISISTVSSTGEWLNGSATKHRSYVTISFTGPDGQDLLTAALSFEQFAAALFDTMAKPCTIQRYWSTGEGSVRLREVVRPPASVKDRMKQRLWHTLDENDDQFEKILAELSSAADGKTRLGKTKAREMLRSLEMIRSHREANADFVVEQSLEEVSSIVESAAIHLAQQYGCEGGSAPLLKAAGLKDARLIEGEESESPAESH